MKKHKVLSSSLALLVAGVTIFGFISPAKSSATVPGVNELVSVDSSGGQASQASSYTSTSSDGRYVALQSYASNLVSGDTNGVNDIFLRDRNASTTIRISVSSAGAQANGDSTLPRISYDGRYVVYTSLASNLVSGDTNGVNDVFIYDTQNATTTLVSANSSGTIGNSTSYQPDVSADGRFVTFESSASNFVSGISGYGVGNQIFVKDMTTGAIKALSVNSSGTQSNSSNSMPRISCDGNVVAFTSNATNLVSGDTNGSADVFVDVLGWSGDKLTSPTISGDGSSTATQVSCDGNYVAIGSYATNLVSGDSNSASDVFRYNRLNGQLDLASKTTGGIQSNKDSTQGVLSGDGRYMALDSRATNMDSRATVENDNIYIRDMKNGTTELVTVTVGGQGLGFASNPAISPDGTYVSYASAAEEFSWNPGRAIVAGDTNGYTDVMISKTGY